jgi:F-type H+-transporting ATPase subunit gamma
MLRFACVLLQASLVAEEVLREGGDAVRVVFNKFHSAISFKPTMATVLNADVRRCC